jgi:hypothetical protein
MNDVRFTCCGIPLTLQSRHCCFDVIEMQGFADGQIPRRAYTQTEVKTTSTTYPQQGQLLIVARVITVNNTTRKF